MKTEEQNEKKLSVKWNENQLKVWKQKKKGEREKIKIASIKNVRKNIITDSTII